MIWYYKDPNSTKSTFIPSWRYSTLRARAYTTNAGLTTMFSQTEVKDHPASLVMTFNQDAEF
jgi:hypothetical protein